MRTALLRLLLSLLSSLALSQTIPEVISSNSQLSLLASLLASSPNLTEQLRTADNFTFLAPNDNAFSKWFAGHHSSDYIKATLMYHLLNGTYPSPSFSSKPRFIPTALTNTSFCNVTGGQRVEAFKDEQVVFRSAINTNSTVVTADIIATGGIVHIVDQVLYMPFDSIATITALNLSYFITLGNEGGLLSTENRPFIDNFTLTPDLTWFVPNSAQALSSSAHLNITDYNQTVLQELVKYQSISRVVYSTELVDGMTLMTDAGLPLLITVRDGDIWVNTAKVTGRDNFGANGVFHITDDLLNPFNIDRPSFPSNKTVPSDKSTGLPLGAKIGIGAGASVLGIVIVTATAFMLIKRWRKRRSDESQGKENWIAWQHEQEPRELSSNPLDETPQLETFESAVELPARYWESRLSRSFR